MVRTTYVGRISHLSLQARGRTLLRQLDCGLSLAAHDYNISAGDVIYLSQGTLQPFTPQPDTRQPNPALFQTPSAPCAVAFSILRHIFRAGPYCNRNRGQFEFDLIARAILISENFCMNIIMMDSIDHERGVGQSSYQDYIPPPTHDAPEGRNSSSVRFGPSLMFVILRRKSPCRQPPGTT